MMSDNGPVGAIRNPSAPEAAEEPAVITSEAKNGVGRTRWLLGLGGLLAGLAAFGIGEAVYQRIPVQKLTFDTFGGTVTTATGETIAIADVRNAALAFGVLGLCLGGGLGIVGGLARRSSRAAGAAGLLGSILGAAMGGGGSLAMLPCLMKLSQIDPNYEMLSSVAMHALPWGLAGASAGLAFAVGLGRWRQLARAAAAGLVGAMLGAIAFDLIGAGFFPFAATGEPISATPATRLLARLLVAVGTTVAVLLILGGRMGSRIESTRKTELVQE